jgi:hypothetical protein
LLGPMDTEFRPAGEHQPQPKEEPNDQDHGCRG